MFGNECEPCQHCQQCKQRIARRYLHLCWYYLVLLLNCDHGEKVIYSVLPTALKFDCNVLSATNVPEFKGRDETKGCNKRDILGETFVSGIPACALCLSCESCLCNVHCLQFALCAMFTVCNLHCVCGPQLSISHRLLTHPTDPFPTVFWTIHPLHIARCNRPLLSKE